MSLSYGTVVRYPLGSISVSSRLDLQVPRYSKPIAYDLETEERWTTRIGRDSLSQVLPSAFCAFLTAYIVPRQYPLYMPIDLIVPS